MSTQFVETDKATKKFFEGLDIPYQIHKIKNEGKSISYVETGLEASSSPLILFIHGAPGSWSAFRDYLADPEFTSVARLISMDRLGYGDSNSGQGEEEIKAHVDAALAIINRYKSSEIYLVGHSYGGPIVGNLAANFPDLIDGILMAAPLIDSDNEPVRWYAHLCNISLFKAILPDYINVATVEKMSHSNALRAIENDWKKIRIPVIHYHGAKDNIAPYRVNIEFSKKYIPSKYLQLVTDSEANHFVPWNQAEKMKELIFNMMSLAKENNQITQ